MKQGYKVIVAESGLLQGCPKRTICMYKGLWLTPCVSAEVLGVVPELGVRGTNWEKGDQRSRE